MEAFLFKYITIYKVVNAIILKGYVGNHFLYFLIFV
jgi:hypothetical protein